MFPKNIIIKDGKEDKQMKKDVYDKFYKKVPQGQIEKLKRFRSTHPHKQY
jgi:hypothetical protein